VIQQEETKGQREGERQQSAPGMKKAGTPRRPPLLCPKRESGESAAATDADERVAISRWSVPGW